MFLQEALKINISENSRIQQILSEVQLFVENAREIARIGKEKFTFDEEMYRVWDLHKEGKSPTEIVKEVWTDEFATEGQQDDYASDKVYKKLAQKYKSQGFDDFDERAWNEAYRASGSGRIKLYMKVRDKLKRMEKLFQKFRSH